MQVETATMAPASFSSGAVSPLSDSWARRTFWWLVGVHVLLWIAIPALTQPNAPLDTLEMIYWGHEQELGYYKHPPLPAWLAAAVSGLAGNAVWPTYVLAQLMTLICFWSVFQLGRDIAGIRIALLSVFLLEACYYYNYTTPEFNNNVTSRAWWALAVLFLYRGLRRQHLRHWALAGLALGLGMLSKYDTAILAVCMLLFSVVTGQGRQAWKTAGPACLLGAALLCFLPHAIWLWQQDFPTVQYFLHRSSAKPHWYPHLLNPLKFAGSQFGAVGPVFLLAVPLTGWVWKAASSQSEQERFDRKYLLWMSAGPFLLVLLVGCLTGVRIRSMWGTAMWTFTGLSVLCCLRLQLTDVSSRLVIRRCIVVGLLFVAALGIRNTVFPAVRGKGSRVHFPGRQLASHARDLYRRQTGLEPAAVGGPWWEAANVACYGVPRASVYANLDAAICPWTSDERFRSSGGMIVWSADADEEKYRQEVLQRFPEAEMQPSLTLNWDTPAALRPLTFRFAVVRPAAVSGTKSQRLSARPASAASLSTR